MESNYSSGIVPLASDLSYLNNGSRFRNDGATDVRVNRNEGVTRDRSDVLGEKIECNKTIAENGIEGIYRVLQFGKIDDQFTKVCTRIGDAEMRTTDQMNTAERRNDDKFAAIVKEQGESAKETLKQFCSLKELHKDTQNIIQVTSLSEENRGLRDQLEQERINRCCPPTCTPVDPCCNGSSGGGNNDTQIILQAQAQQFQALQQTMQSMATMISDAIKTIDVNPGNSGSS